MNKIHLCNRKINVAWPIANNINTKTLFKNKRHKVLYKIIVEKLRPMAH